jgi:uncharacterized delta-60 repeat protein
MGLLTRTTDVLVRDDGGVVVAGSYQSQATGWTVLTGLAAWRADGSPDGSFGAGGSVRDLFAAAPNSPYDRAAGDSPRIAALGGGAVAVADAAYDAVTVARLTASGAPDPTFNGTGRLTLRAAEPSLALTLAGVAPLPGGSLAVAAMYWGNNDTRLSTWRLPAAGAPDESFGPGGAARTNVDVGSNVADLRAAPDGSVVVAGGNTTPEYYVYDDADAWLTRLLPDPAPRSAPVADAGGPYVVAEGRDLFLDARRSFDADAPLARFEWDADYDGVTFTPEGDGPGVYYFPLSGAALRGPSSRVVAVRVTDSDGNATIATTTLTVNNVAPAAVIGGAPTATEGVPYTLVLSSSDPSAADAIQYWTIDWGDGRPPQRVEGNPPSVTHLFPDGPALDRVTATATDNDGTWAATVGRPDPAYGGGGVLSLNSINIERARAAARAAGGDFFVAGSSQNGGVPSFFHFKPDGTYDATFNGGRGFATLPAFNPVPHLQVAGDFHAHGSAVAVQPDGRAVAALPTYGVANGTIQQHWALFRINPDGSPDASFGTGGVVGPMFSGAGDGPDDLLVWPDGKILVAGEADGRFTLMRFNPDGTPDATFGAGGIVNDTFGAVAGRARAVRTTPDGRIVAAGWVGDNGFHRYAVARYTAGGAPDPTFGAGGTVTGVFDGYLTTELTALALAPDGATVVGAESFAPGSFDPRGAQVIRLRADGSPDPAFGRGGVAEVSALPAQHLGALALLPDGKLLVAGNARPERNADGEAALQRLLPDGSPDPSFGNAPGTPGLIRKPVLAGTAGTVGVHDLLPGPGGDVLLLASPQRADNSSPAGIMLFRFNVLGPVAVANTPPAVTLSAPQVAARPGQPFVLDLNYADPGDDQPTRWLVDWGDETGVEVVEGPATQASHPYTAAGAYTVTASAVDDDGTWPAAAAQQARVIAPATLGAGGALTITASDFADTIGLSIDLGRLVVSINSLTESFDAADVNSIDLRALAGNDTITVGSGVQPGGGMRIAGGEGNDALTLAPGAGRADFDGGNGADSLSVAGTGGDDAVTLAAASVTVSPAAGGAVTTTFTSAETLKVSTLDGADVVTVAVNDATLPTGPWPITIDPGAGDDRVDVTGRTAFRTLTVVRGAGADTVDVTAGSLGAVVVGADGPDTTYFDGTGGDDTFTLLQQSARSGTRSVAVQNNTGPTLFPLTIRAGPGNDTFTYAERPTFGPVLEGGAGDDLYVFPATNPFLSGDEVAVRGGDGTDTVLVDYSMLPGGTTFTITDSMVSTGFGRFFRGDAEAVAVRGGPGADTFRVTPSDAVTFSVVGGNPAPGASTGDRLSLLLDGADGMQLEPDATAPGAGRYTFTNRRPVNFDGIELMPEFDPPRVAAATFLDTLAPSVRFTFNERITGLGLTALLLEDPATGATRRPVSTQSDAANNTYTFVFTNLPDGDYRARLSAASVTDLAGNRMAEDFVLTFHNTNAVHVAGRHVFYNNSAADGRNPALTPADNDARASDKSALLPGQAATFANVTGSSQGINGVMIDLARAGNFNPAARYFRFEVSDGSPTGWRFAPAPSAFGILRGAGINGTDRVLISWPDRAIRDGWLRVIVFNPSNTSAVLDTFYFGNLVGDVGFDRGAATVNASDLALTRAAVGRTDAAGLGRFDFNRDGAINAADVLITRNNQRHTLRPFTAPAAPAPSSFGDLPAPAAARTPTRPPRRGLLDLAEPELLA